jgi:N-acetylglutamate synthase-like GNAT family acetyltransferase
MIYEFKSKSILISTDKRKLNISFIHHFLENSYWSPGISRKLVQRAISNSLCFGVYHQNSQIGFSRVITDFTSFGYLADVFISEDFRGKGYSKLLMKAIMKHPELQNFRRWMLATRDAHGLYRQFGFTSIPNPEILMQIHRPDIYKKKKDH